MYALEPRVETHTMFSTSFYVVLVIQSKPDLSKHGEEGNHSPMTSAAKRLEYPPASPRPQVTQPVYHQFMKINMGYHQVHLCELGLDKCRVSRWGNFSWHSLMN